MKKWILLLWTSFLALPLLAEKEPERRMVARKVTIAPKIDGLLNEAVWQQAPYAHDFIINSPNFGGTPAQRTKVYVIYDDQAIYIGAYLYDDPKLVRKQLTPRDGESRQDVDYFAVYFDTYNDDQNGFQFLVTSRNVQTDGRINPNRSSQFGPPSDYSWDAVWESKVSFQPDGWIVEMKIPYFSLRFAQKDLQDWGVNFQRYVRRNNESSYWNPVNPNQNGFVNQFGLLAGLEKLTPPLRLSFLPYITSGYRTTPTAGGRVNQFLRNGGMDVKYGVNESFTLDMTLIPDFGQVISDNVINNLSPFEVQFQENRPFFTEGTEIFNKSGLFYSRRVGATPTGYFRVNAMANDSIRILSNPGITQLYNASKFSGRNRKKLGIGIFNAVGAPMFAELENIHTGEIKRIETEPLANYNLVVLDQALKNRSSITFTNANVLRSGGARNSNVSALDISLFDAANRFGFQWRGAYSKIMGRNPYDGFKSFTSFGKVSGKIQWNVTNNIESDRYDPNDLGILRAPNEVTTSAAISYNQLTPTRKFNAFSYGFNIRHEMMYKPFAYSNVRFGANAFWFFKNFWDLSINVFTQPFWQDDYFELRTPGRFMKKVPFTFVGINGSTDSRKRLFVRMNLGFAESAPIANDPFFTAQMGIRFRFSDRLSLDVDLRRVNDKGQFGYAFIREANGDPIIGRRVNKEFTTLINGIYNFTPRMNLTLRARHYWSNVKYEAFFNVRQDGFWTDRPFINGRDQNFNVWNLDVFYTWDFNYGSRLVVGWKNWMSPDYPVMVSGKNYLSNVSELFRQPLANEFTFRFIYFVDYLSLKKKKKLS